MPLKVKPLTDTQLRAYEAKRDLAAELLESVQQTKAANNQVGRREPCSPWLARIRRPCSLWLVSSCWR